MELNPKFDALMDLQAQAAEAKQTLMDTYHKLNQEQQNQALAIVKEAKQNVYRAFDMLTPDEIREYGKYKEAYDAVFAE